MKRWVNTSPPRRRHAHPTPRRPGLNRTFDGKTHGAYVLGTNLTSGAIVARVPAPLLDAGGIFRGGMALGLMPPTAPGVCASSAVVSGFSAQDSSVLIVTTLPLGASAHPQAVQCKVPGYVPQNSFSAPPQSPGFFASAAQRLVISVDRAEDGAPCWLSVHLPTCSAQCIPARLPVPWAGAGARGTLATVHSLPGSSIGVGLGHVTFPNGSSFLVGGWLNASDAGGATLLPSSRRALAPWPSTFQSLSAFDAESGVLYWPGYDGGGNALVATRLPGDPVDPTGTWASHAIGHFCQDHTDDFAGQGCPYAMFTGSHPRDGAWA